MTLSSLCLLTSQVEYLTPKIENTTLDFLRRDLPSPSTFDQEVVMWKTLWQSATKTPCNTVTETLNDARAFMGTFLNVITFLHLLQFMPVTTA